MIDSNNLISKDSLKKSYESYSEYFNEIIMNVVKILQKDVKLMAQPTYKSRVKSFSSYYKKVLRLKKEELTQDHPLIYLTDMMGIRMICAFLEDINIALDQIKTIFEIKEVEIKGAEKKFSEFGYESVHVLIKIPDDCLPPLEGKYKDLKKISDEVVCEIQIRTILQDAWAEVEHELIYKTEFNPFDIPLRRKLASLNASLTLADITFQEIRDYQKKLQGELEQRRHTFYELTDNLLDEKIEKKEQTENISRITPFIQGTIDDLLLRAIHAHNSGNLDEAIAIYSKIIESVSEKESNVLAVIRKHRGMAYFAKNDYENALIDFEKSLEADPNAYRSHYYRGIVLAVQKKYAEAITSYEKSLEINPYQAHTHFRIAMAYFEINEFEKSLDNLNSAIKLGMDPDECKVLNDKLVKKLGMGM